MFDNEGFQVCGERLSADAPASIVIVGLNRGGTSAIAKSLHALGIPLGKRFSDPTYEDLDLAAAFRAKDWKRFEALAKDYAVTLGRFAWKLPDSLQQLDRVHRYLGRPHYIFVYRDIFATALRHSAAFDEDLVDSMTRSLAGYQKIADFVRKRKPSALHVSYEKLIHDRERYARHLLAFCALEPSAERIQAVVAATSPYPPSYARWAHDQRERQRLRARGLDGHIDSLTGDAICGWLVRTGPPAESASPLAIEIFVNGSRTASAVADLHRPDLIDAGICASGRAGFRVSLANRELHEKDLVEVRVPELECGLSATFSR